MNFSATLHAAAEYYLDGRYAEALRLYNELLQEHPGHPDTLNDAGLTHYQLGNADRATACFAEALKHDPSYETAFFNLIDVSLDSVGGKAAERWFDAFSGSIPESLEKTKRRQKIRQNRTGSKQHIFVFTQPRSGSTVFWKTFRQDPRLACYNEPFNQHLRRHVEIGRDYYNKKSETHNELFREFLAIPDLMKEHWSAIQPKEELYPDLIGHQKTYLDALLSTSAHCCIDVIRCNAKVDDLRKIAPSALFIHLVRDPRAWVTSHLRPYGEWLPGLPDDFFRYDGWFDYWSRQTVAQALGLKGYAHEQLLQVWNFFVEQASKQPMDIVVQFEAFAANPERMLRSIYQHLELDYPSIDCSHIHAPNPPHRHAAPEWRKAISTHVSPSNHQFVYPFAAGVAAKH